MAIDGGPDAARLAPRARGGDARRNGSQGSGPRVLVVDDDRDIRRLLVDELREEGFDAREAAHGAEAMSVVQGWRPDVILLDLVMPWMNGYEFAEAYRSQPGPHAPIIVVTAVGAAAARRSVADLGAEQVVLKPFAVDDLLKLVGHYARYWNI